MDQPMENKQQQPSMPLMYMPGTDAPQYAHRQTPPTSPPPPVQPYYVPPQTTYQQPPAGYSYYQPPRPAQPPHPQAWLGPVGLTLSIISLAAMWLIPFWYIWLACGIAGLVMAIVAKSKQVPGGKSTAALVCAIIGIVFNLMFGSIMLDPTLSGEEIDFYEDFSYSFSDDDYTHDM